MAEMYIPLEDAARFEGLQYRGMQSRVNRNPADFLIHEEPNPNGGKPLKLVALSSLTVKARKAYKAAQKVEQARQPEGGDAVENENRVPWYVEADPRWFIDHHQGEYYRAVDLKNQIVRLLEYDGPGRTAYTDRFALDMGMKPRTLRRKVKEYNEAQAWADEMDRQEPEYNHDHFMILCLCRKPQTKDTFPSLSDAHRACIENTWFHEEFAKNKPTVHMLYDEVFLPECMAKGWEIPSYQTVARYVHYLMERRKLKNAHKLAEQGIREWKRNIMVKGRRDSSTVPVMGLVQGDGHTFDFFVEYTDPSNGKVSATRPVMAAWIDTRTRRVLGCLMAKHLNQDIIKLSIAKMIYQAGTSPRAILIDNGKEYTAKSVLGRDRSERSSTLLTLDAEALGFVRSVGIEHDYRSLPYQAWTKGNVERFFETVCLQFSRWFTSYVGTLTASRTTSKVEKNADKLLRQGKLVTMEECFELFEAYLDKYHNKPHRGLQEAREKWFTPIELYANAEERWEKAPPAPQLLEMLLMRAEDAYVSPTGIRRFGSIYMDYALQRYIGSHVNIRWDPADLSKLFIYDQESGSKICEAEKQPYLGFHGYSNPEDVEAHVRNQNRHIADTRDDLEEMRTPPEARVGLPPVAGLPDFMIEAKKQKVISLPQDSQFKQEVREKSSRKKAAGENPVYKTLADEALEKLRKAE